MKDNILYDSKYLQMKKAPSPSGKSDWMYAHRPNAKDIVVLVPVIHEQDGDVVIFLETERPPLKEERRAERCIELPAGLVGDEDSSETVEDALAKELLEETGYEADKITIVSRNVSSSSGLTSETSTFAIADINEDKIKQEPITDNGVIKGIHKVPLKDIRDWLKIQEDIGKAISSQALSGLFFLQNR